MKIKIHVTPNSKSNSIERSGDSAYKIKVTAKPEHGKANEAVISLLSEHFGVKRRDIVIISGASSRDKVVEISQS